MPFGLKNAPATFQRMMHNILKNFNWKICLIYLDDVIIFSNNLDQHCERLDQILKCFYAAGIKLSPKKCKFMLSEVSYLGHTIGKEGIKTDENKVEKIKNLEIPKFESELVSFLGFCGYYRKFIKNYADIVAPLESICCKGTKRSPIKWTKEASEAFEHLKLLLTSSPILAFPSRKGRFILDTDASSIATGAVLSQIQEGQEKVIAYASNKLSKSEQQYCTTRKELLAVHRYIFQFKHYLWGNTFIVRTDHKSLKWFMSWKNPNTSQYSRWRNDLEEFDFIIEHRAGKHHINADFMSRLNCEQCEIPHSNPKRKRNVKIFEENSCQSKIIRKITKQENYWSDQSKDKNIMLVMQLMKQKRIREPFPRELNQFDEEANNLWSCRNSLRIRGDTLFYLDKNDNYLFIPPNIKRKEIILVTHKDLCHIGHEKLYYFLKRRYFWPLMKEGIRKEILSCENCAFTKNNDYGVTPLQPCVMSFPFQRIAIDITGPLPVTDFGYKYLLGVIDYFSKYSMLIPLRQTDSQSICEALFSKWISVFGCPYQIISDNAHNINGRQIQELCQLLKITKTSCSPYHPKSNGLVERLFRTVKECLRSLLYGKRKSLWDKMLTQIEYMLRSTINKTTGYSPYEIVFGKEMKTNIAIDHEFQSKIIEYKYAHHYIIELKKSLSQIKEIVQRNLGEKSNKWISNQKFLRKPLKVGDKVMVKMNKQNQTNLGSKYNGVYEIVKVYNDFTYDIKDSSDKIIRRHRDEVKMIENINQKNITPLTYSSSSSQDHEEQLEEENNDKIRSNCLPETKRPIREKRKVERYGYENQ